MYNCDYKCNYYTSLDWKGPGWYRVVDPAGSMLAESAEGIDEYHCGTQGAAWLRQGTHSDIENGQTKDVTICLDKKCLNTYIIQIKNCGGFYAYHLPELTSCDSGYCTM